MEVTPAVIRASTAIAVRVILAAKGKLTAWALLRGRTVLHSVFNIGCAFRDFGTGKIVALPWRRDSRHGRRFSLSDSATCSEHVTWTVVAKCKIA